MDTMITMFSPISLSSLPPPFRWKFTPNVAICQVLPYNVECRVRKSILPTFSLAKILSMRVLKIKDEKKANKLSERLLRKGYVVALVDREEDVKKPFVKKADVVIVVK